LKNKSLIVALIIIGTTLTIVSCSDDSSTSPDSRDITKLFDNTGYHHLDDVVDNWDIGSLNGIVFLTKEYEKIYSIHTINVVTDSTDKEFTSLSLNAGLFDSNFKPFDTQNFYINEIQLSGSIEGKYEPTKKLVETDLKFGSGVNLIRIDGSNKFDQILDSISLGQAVQINNFTRGDTISKSSGYILSWSGSTNATKAYISISPTDSFQDRLLSDTVISGTSWYQNNTGSVDLTPFIHNITFPGTYDLTVTLFEPHYIELSNGKQILIIGETTHKVSFKLID
jgi:hypothetical protein